jgi:putative peptidoglycan lipid II flippase
VAVATVALPRISRTMAERDDQRLREEITGALRLTAFLTIPATVGLLVLARPIVGLLYEHGRFTGHDTEQTAAAVALYCLGLVSYSALKVIAPAFYALKDTRAPVMASAASVAINIALSLLLKGVMGHGGLALATSVAVTANVAALLVLLTRRIGGLSYRPLAGPIAKIVIASAAMGAVVLGAARAAAGWGDAGGVIAKATVVVLCCVAGAGIYWCFARALGVEDAARPRRRGASLDRAEHDP